jgi:hypothetical protein
MWIGEGYRAGRVSRAEQLIGFPSSTAKAAATALAPGLNINIRSTLVLLLSLILHMQLLVSKHVKKSLNINTHTMFSTLLSDRISMVGTLYCIFVKTCRFYGVLKISLPPPANVI